ncbi:helix-turn-helix domain-containing protein [uncultured Clostridium sp.]|uniref:winged helix-turn-helix transcriptional regulator n=1 Tax=uncultured Clostridium sp. TaxID=59620 RepID=UPI00262EF64A|nr:helix-turn-helix domain-containing protein [uncultured Clostridium sp.]
MKVRDTFTCPLELCFDVIKGKWKPIIIWRLRCGKTSPAQLQRDINGITQKMLLEQLKELADAKMVDKIIYPGYPLRVEYFLTSRGEEILEALKIMQKIGTELLVDLK